MGAFLGLLKFQMFFGVLEIHGTFGGERLMLGPSLRMKKKGEYPPLLPGALHPSQQLLRPQTHKRILWQAVKAQMKCCLKRHFIRACTVCQDKIYLQRMKFKIVWKL